MELTIYYSVRNGGDGSAYPTFMESKELAEWDQDHLYEGWGESCTGSLTIQSDSPITVNAVETKEEYFVGRYLCNYGWGHMDDNGIDEMEEFIEVFFPDGLPIFNDEVEKKSKEALTKLRQKRNE